MRPIVVRLPCRWHLTPVEIADEELSFLTCSSRNASSANMFLAKSGSSGSSEASAVHRGVEQEAVLRSEPQPQDR